MAVTPSAQILIVARRDPQDPLRRILLGAGYPVLSADSPSSAMRTVQRSHPAVIVADPRLLTPTAADSLAVLAEAHTIPLISVWSGPDSLLAEVEKVLGKPDSAEREAPQLVVGPLTIDFAGHEARIGDSSLDLTAREFELLCHLARHPGWVYSRQELLEQVWGYEFGDPRVVTVHMGNLRKKLEAVAPGCGLIETVRNVGYKLVAPAAAMAPSEVTTETGNEAGTLPAAGNGQGALGTAASAASCAAAIRTADERRLVAVLLAHIGGLTTLAETLGFESLHGLAGALFDCIIPCVERYGGRVERKGPDTFIALFGAPVAHDNDAEMAVRAAMDIRDAVSEFGAEKGVEGLSVHIGINTGMVIAGSLGNGVHDYSVIGQSVDDASCLANAAGPGEVLVGPETLKLVGGFVDAEPAGEMKIRGRPGELSYQRINNVESGQTSVRGGRGIESALVGRDEQMALFRASLDRLDEGLGCVVLVTGDAGVGKSRLTAEVRREAASRGLKWLEARTLSYGQNISYLPFREIVQADCGIELGDSAEEKERKLRERATRLFADKADDFLPVLGSLLGIARGQFGEYEPLVAEEEGVRRIVVDRAQRYARRLSTEKPLILAFEDVHWLDRSSAALIENLLPLAAQAPVLICLVGRAGTDSITLELLEAARRHAGSQCVHIQLSPLSQRYTEQLVSKLLRGSEIEPRVMRTIRTRSEGNPFFVEEIIRHLIDLAMLQRDEGGRWTATIEGELSIPSTVQGVISARIDRLAESTRQDLLCASVIGRSFFRRLLRSLSASTEPELGENLRSLQDHQLIFLKRLEPEPEYAFKHALVQEAAYGTLLLKQRRELHRRVARAIEELYSGQIRDLYGILAYHYTRAEDWQNAQSYLLKAGDQSVSMAADAEAVAYYRDAMSALLQAFDETSESTDSHSQVKWFVTATEPFWLARSGGELLDSAQVFYDKVLKACGPTDPRTMAATAVLAGCHFQRGAHDACIHLAERAIRSLDASGRDDDPSLTRLLLILGLCFLNNDRFFESEEVFRRALALEEAKTSGDAGVLQDLNIYLSTNLFFLGRHDEMRQVIEEALRRFDLKGTQRGWMLLINLSSVNVVDGRWEEAAVQAQECVDGIVNPYLKASAARHLAEVRFAQGAYLEAEEHLAYAVGVLEEGAEPRHLFEALTVLAETQLQAGKIDKAEETVLSVLRRMEATVVDHCQAVALWTLAGVEMTRGRLDLAEAFLERSEAVVSERFSPHHPFCAELCLRRAHLRRQQARWMEAEEDFENAVTLMADIGGADHPRIVQMKRKWEERSAAAVQSAEPGAG